MKKITILMLSIAVFISTANAKNIFVDPTSGTDAAGKGASWEAAVKTLAGAVNVAYTSFAAGDNIYVKGGTLTYSAAFTSNATANYYGSCDLSNTGTSTTRTVFDKDGNGIIEPWEFQNPTVISTTANCITGNVTALTFNNTGYTVDGFTITHTASNTTTYYLRSINITVGVFFTNCSMKYSVVTATSTSFPTSTSPFGLFFTGGGTISNCLFEKNSLTYNGTSNNAVYPFINISGSASQRVVASNCVVRNNLITANYNNVAVTNSGLRGMLVTIVPAATYYTTVKNWTIYNNEMKYVPSGTSPSSISTVGASLHLHYATSSLDSLINCTVANNSATNIGCAGLIVYNINITHRLLNNTFWNNKSGSTVANVNLTNFPANSLFTKNITNGGNTATTDNGTSITANDYALSDVNNTGNNPLFKNPTSLVGSSLSGGSLSLSDSTSIKQSNWKLQSTGSYLYGKGVSLTNNVTDKDNKYYANPPSAGAYEYVTTPVISFTQDLSTLKLGDSPVTLTASSSAITNAATITFTSSNSSVVSVSGNTLTLVGPGTATVTAQQGGNAYYEPAANVTQNVTVSIINAGFEDAVNSYSVTENSLNVLRRVSGIQDVTTQIASPTATATSITSGMWVKKAPNTAYVKGEVTTTDKHSGNSSLNFYIAAGTPNTNYDNWSNNILLQKLNLVNIQKYTVSFWAKIDPTASNVASTVTAFITDNTKKTNLSCAIPLTGGTTWTQYSATFDIPTFKAANVTADFTTAFVGVGLTTTYNAATFKTNYSGVLLDDFTVTPTSATTVLISTSGNNGSVTGGSAYAVGSIATVVAAPASGYKFVNWTEGGNEVSTNASYNFTVSTTRTLVANFTATTVPVSASTLTGFTYNYSSGPSSEQSFTVSGTNLNSNIVLTAPVDYQISTTSGTGFGTSITLTQSNGTVTSTTIYVRLKSGLGVNSYNSENITVATYGMTTQNVACSGNVSQATPTLTVFGTQSYDYNGSAQGPSTINYNGDGTTSLSYTNVGGAAYSSAIAPSNVGTYQVIASATAGTNYTATTSSAYTFTIYSSGNISFDTNVSALTLSAASNLSVASGNTLTIDANATVNSVTVAPGAKLTLNAGNTLNTGSITLQSDASGTATFVDYNSNGGLTVNGTSTVQQYLSISRNWYITTPLTGATASVINPQNSSNLLYWYDETKGSPSGWTAVTSNSTTMTPGLGYIVKPANDGVTLSYTGGSLNTGTTPSLTIYRTAVPDHAGFNLIGNPYPSYLNARTVVNSSANLDKTIWYRTQVNNSTTYKFDTYNTASGQYINASGNNTYVVGTVPPMQAFWVRVSSGQSSASVNFSNDYRTHAVADTANPLKVKNQISMSQPSIRLQVTNGVNSDETLIYSDQAAANAYDIYDSQKMSNGNTSIPELFTVADNQQLAINGVNQIPYNTEMPLGFTTGAAGNFSIKASQLANLVAGTQVVLKDYQVISNPVTTDLTDGSSYEFNSPVTTNNVSRFALIFKAPSMTTGINPAKSVDVWISTHNGQIMINAVNKNGTRLEVYNAIGQKVFSENLTNSNAQLNTKFIAGTYLVKLSSNGHSVIKKVIID